MKGTRFRFDSWLWYDRRGPLTAPTKGRGPIRHLRSRRRTLLANQAITDVYHFERTGARGIDRGGGHERPE